MERDLELIIARLEILEIEVCNILQNPGNIGKRFFLFSPILEILEICFPSFPYPGNIGNMLYIYICFGIFSKKDARRNFTQNAPVNGPRSLI